MTLRYKSFPPLAVRGDGPEFVRDLLDVAPRLAVAQGTGRRVQFDGCILIHVRLADIADLEIARQYPAGGLTHSKSRRKNVTTCCTGWASSTALAVRSRSRSAAERTPS